jgi:DNA-binding CsgD family transcriptional regulator
MIPSPTPSNAKPSTSEVDARSALVPVTDLLVLEHLKSLVDTIPLGLLLLDMELQPVWFNVEAARACAVWNYGERNGMALRERRVFQVPAPILAVAADLRTRWNQGTRPSAVAISEMDKSLHACITLHIPRASERAAFHVQLDYRRPRGDRDREVSESALALLARLTAREREVALRVRDGLSTVEIARELHRSPLTIKTQLGAIYQKLGVGCRTRVAAILNR